MKRAAILAAAVAALVFAASAGAVDGNNPIAAWVTDGTVDAVVATPKQVYLGGDFTLIGKETGSWVGIDANGSVPAEAPAVFDQVDAAVPDGARGWFLLTGSSDEPTLVHLLADRTLDKKWRLDINGTIHAIAGRGGTLYVAGDFTKVAGQPHHRVVAIDMKTHKPLGWDAQVSARKAKDFADVNVLAVSPDGGTLYFGGQFALVHANKRLGALAAISTATGKVTAWAPSTDGDVYDLTAAGSVVYIGGDFGHIDGRTRTELGAVGAAAGAVTDWNPQANGAVSVIVPSNGKVYIGGTFTSVGGKSRRGMAALRQGSGDATGWDANVGGAVQAILVSGNTVYFGGEFDSVGGQPRSNLAAADASSGALAGWDPRADKAAQVLVQGAVVGRVIAGGAFATVGATRREGLAAVSIDGSTVLPWSAPLTGTIRALAYNPSSGAVTFGGRYRLNEQATQRSLGVIAGDGSVVPWGGDFSSFVSSIALQPDGSAYVGGAFTIVQGKARKRLAALDPTGALTSWNSGANGLVNALLLDADQLYVAGNFTSIGGATRKGVAVLDTGNGLANGWDAGLDGNVLTLALHGDSLYLGGEFENVGPKARNYLASVVAETAAPTNWDPDPDDTVDALCLDPAGSLLYAAGDFTQIGRATRDAAEFDTAAGFLLGWRPAAPYGRACTTSLDGATLYIGGESAFYVYH
jgi:hypothetical protein